MQLSKDDAANLLDALQEWFECCGPKELEDEEVGLNEDRYRALEVKLLGEG